MAGITWLVAGYKILQLDVALPESFDPGPERSSGFLGLVGLAGGSSISHHPEKGAPQIHQQRQEAKQGHPLVGRSIWGSSILFRAHFLGVEGHERDNHHVGDPKHKQTHKHSKLAKGKPPKLET